MAGAFEVVSKLGKKISVSEERWFMISNYKHPIIKGKEKEVREALSNPDEIRKSKTDPRIFLYHKFYGREAISAVVKHLNGKGFIITAYTTTSIKEGEIIWKKSG